MTDAKIRGAIGYKGVVELQFKNGSHKHSLLVNNEGTEELGTLISIVLSGDQRNIASISQRAASHIGLQSEVNDLRADNDARYKSITTSVDLNEVKKKAIKELGMSYPKEKQVVYYSIENNNYMDQYSDIPKQ